MAADHWSSADLHSLLRGELLAFLDASGFGPQVDLQGAVVALPPGAAQPLSIAIHELATNAVKHGALSVPTGRVMIFWEMTGATGDVLRLSWIETGGPLLQGAPIKRGFGSRVLTGTLRQQLGGSIDMEWKESGLVCRIEMPLRRPAKAEDTKDIGYSAE